MLISCVLQCTDGLRLIKRLENYAYRMSEKTAYRSLEKSAYRASANSSYRLQIAWDAIRIFANQTTLMSTYWIEVS